MFKSKFVIVFLMSLMMLFLLTSCSSMGDVYEFQRPDTISECYEFLESTNDTYETVMFLLREEKLDGVDVNKVRMPAKVLVSSWDDAVNILHNYSQLTTPTPEDKDLLYTAIDTVRFNLRLFLAAANPIIGVDIKI